MCCLLSSISRDLLSAFPHDRLRVLDIIVGTDGQKRTIPHWFLTLLWCREGSGWEDSMYLVKLPFFYVRYREGLGGQINLAGGSYILTEMGLC